jgi:SpoVK/Ycf46/Vps4 family AAA+-type ATPase
LDPASITAAYTLSLEQIRRAADVAIRVARAEGRPTSAEDLKVGARAQDVVGLERLARRVEPEATWEDLILPPEIVDRLREIAERLPNREYVLGKWGFKTSSRWRGISCLFSGDSGTGKTLAGEVIARVLGLDLYVIDLSAVVSKYVGETEKNLRKVFDAAQDTNAILLFDEADALFGKRSEVKDSHDRWANIEVAYLLQRIEAFDGLAILTTNLGGNLDPAFARRLTAVVHFPQPDAGQRSRLWQRHLGRAMPLADDIDLEFLSEAFPITGGNIRNVVVSGAFLAASDKRAITMSDLIRGLQREYEKLGRLCVPSEFGPYYPLIATEQSLPHRAPFSSLSLARSTVAGTPTSSHGPTEGT